MAIAIYARKSIERENSVSCETQVEYCKAMIRPDEKNEPILVYIDNGRSGANLEREEFQKMMRGVANGMIRKVIVYRLDRISRSLSDFVGILETLKAYRVQFVSSQEAFDTTGAYGEMIVKLLMVFAEFERQSTVQRITQAYAYRSEKGFFMGGKSPFGFSLMDTVIEGIPTKKLCPLEKEMQIVQLLFSCYANKDVTLRRLSADLAQRGVFLSAAKISEILKNPVYVRADNDIYEYFRTRGAKMIGEPSAFDGTRGLRLYGKTAHKERDFSDLKVVLMMHEGVISSSLWLQCQQKLVKNKKIGASVRNMTSFLGGVVICGECGKTMTVTKGGKRLDGTQTRYFYCTAKEKHEGTSVTLYAEELEKAVSLQVEEKLCMLKDRRAYSKEELDALNARKNRISEIEKTEELLVSSVLCGAAQTDMLSLLNDKARRLAEEKRNLQMQIEELERKRTGSSCETFARQWRSADLTQKKAVCRILIHKIILSADGTAEILWYI